MKPEIIISFSLVICVVRLSNSQDIGNGDSDQTPYEKNPNNPDCIKERGPPDQRDFDVKLENMYAGGSAESDFDIGEDGLISGTFSIPFGLMTNMVHFTLSEKKSTKFNEIASGDVPWNDFYMKFKNLVDPISCVCKCDTDENYIFGVDSKKCNEMTITNYEFFKRFLPQSFEPGNYVLKLLIEPGPTEDMENASLDIYFQVESQS